MKPYDENRFMTFVAAASKAADINEMAAAISFALVSAAKSGGHADTQPLECLRTLAVTHSKLRMGLGKVLRELGVHAQFKKLEKARPWKRQRIEYALTRFLIAPDKGSLVLAGDQPALTEAILPLLKPEKRKKEEFNEHAAKRRMLALIKACRKAGIKQTTLQHIFNECWSETAPKLE